MLFLDLHLWIFVLFSRVEGIQISADLLIRVLSCENVEKLIHPVAEDVASSVR